ncbi:MAG TPA: siroheme synthase CysG [Steroidobacteraceae bacterium]|nr:siroheme synthase CysG [Steroidobacteraceae bacterium]
MDYFPLFMRLVDQPVLVVGAGEVAARKIDLLVRSGAFVTVVAPEASTAVRERVGAQVRLVDAPFVPEHLDGARLVIAATDKRSVNAWVSRLAEARGIPVNVVDDPELSRFIVPSIVDRSPVVVAVSSGGTAPVLVRRLRERFEALLPQGLGRIAAIAGALRERVAERLTDGALRRRFWETWFDRILSRNLEAHSDGRLRLDAESLLAQISSARGDGEVALVGAGPGDPDLLTIRALRRLQDADVIVYDRLVPVEILDRARRDAERIYVGKAAGAHHMPQEEINALLVRLARAGKRVCRLKGGDPFIFGRGGEELQALAAAGIRFEVVPGITAASGCAAYAGIPLTHRDHAQAVTFVTGHGRGEIDELDWATLAKRRQTVVFYMGLSGLERIAATLIEHGADPELPAAVVEHGTTARQRVIQGCLAEVAENVRDANVESPALLIVGAVAGLASELGWFGEFGASTLEPPGHVADISLESMTA